MTHHLDPNHIIDEDYTPSQFERMDQICVQRLNSPDFGRPCNSPKRRVLGVLLVLIGIAILYALVGKHLG